MVELERNRGDQMTEQNTIGDLLAALQQFEDAAECEVQLCMWHDGSGCLMAPESGSGPGATGLEEVFRFDNIDELTAYLERGELLEPIRCEACGHRQPAAPGETECDECGEPVQPQ